ncbi:acetate--CoA ligase family protein [Neobacillus cucumis]|uniref:acetate--CoA ligase family protein n=1 Tax=Neobacillus cucumis TaxID=1740721 RepID=UPI00203CC704|nr:acetate--CoA ligase family protein [Neobacillus cucumis]MCM3726304.1 acetate--CoA ligase family protein [Neobacillus cucumis]
MSNNLRYLFDPDSIAIIGCSPDAKKIGGRPLDYLIKYGYQGNIYPINPNYPEIRGLQCYENIISVQGEIDLAIIALPQKLVLNTFKSCIEKKVRSVVIFSAGFSELGKEGKKEQEELSRLAKENNIRVLGPNCLGLFNVSKGMYATFSTILEEEEPIQGGNIGFVSQSGAFGSHVFTLARQHHIGFSHFVATGNESDIDVADCIQYLAEDEQTDVIACYIEGAKDGKKLTQALKLAKQKNKPVVVLKVGKSDAGMKAAMSHTGSMVGSDAVYDTIFSQYGAYRSNTIDEFIDLAQAFSKLPVVDGNRVAIFTISGGVGIMLADQAMENGLVLPETPVDVQKRLKEMLPIASVKNPLDTTAQISYMPTLLEDFMEAVLKSGHYDSAIVFLGFAGLKTDSLNARIKSLLKVKAKFPQIPLVTVTLNNPSSKKLLSDFGLVVNEDPTRAVKMLSALVQLGKTMKREAVESPRENREVSLKSFILNDSKELTEYTSKKVIAQYDLPVTQEKLANNAEEAVEFAVRIGYPVVLKGMSPQILHKTEKGLVLLHLKDSKEVEEGFNRLKQIIDETENATFEGVLIQEMVTEKSVEMYVGSKKDPVFGQMILVGLGGIYIEVFKDVAMRKAPVSVEMAAEMIEELKSSAMLKEFRGNSAYDVTALSEFISKFSYFIDAFEDEIEEIDLNPTLVFKNDKGVKVVDALMKLV